MVLFSTYRSKRIVAKGFLNGPVMQARALTDYYFQRAWSSCAQWVVPGEMRFWAAGIPTIYFYHRWHEDHSLAVDGLEKALIMRWGGTLEEVRKLSPQDQLRIKAFADLEKLYSAYGPKDTVIQPAGDLLPGKDFYHKHNQHGHH
ncbi:putative mitochondrial hypothetical protein [Leptomonas pyrrhocoris]|uniref:Uncharacterized protein n=1 Tax=Leptomonas pyrrhocoris TaxID=157538 RepID=A0A0M9G025_LEPPY|nr:putative mitochondrial hypothetical protein [Leptomonas pyrrhocoris]XP_015658089.1 putative mitochondrial hypothetical protein [Leptomonas pyrrhocoris]XP_015658090.1 putative mitochondrial hypothetical protein [Leptomonas pyrrhocoris]KPA79649.1 putative mitochondrial hypothetical protein [Leptomonas pyrrhocoris]KPA79650.1 putative mitochondrial hypothetical protein [Leptomonas pyrrhocoris]KPA79651.1 putative mitochondrial hypothetical protein [Leptomonas pyrrhocoris]|eukprot:XP_015658088.1 putative mitochondrial hypothetical protein [Leptomonas pyrrhocoris]